ncbi:MAG TPA: hypothetical protein DCS93_22835 [Microscillaceae bacterium]|nr:hypothetical protein [Microscillaceae bacterium]
MKKFVFLAILAVAVTMSACNHQEEVKPALPAANAQSQASIASLANQAIEVTVLIDGSTSNTSYSVVDLFAQRTNADGSVSYFWPERGTTTFYLTPGTYTFDSQQIYFCGTNRVTQNIVAGAQNVVNLTRWCE